MALIRIALKLFAIVFGILAVAALIVRLRRPSRGDADSDEIALTSIWSGTDMNSHAAAFRGGSIISWWGGTRLDLRDARLAPGARLELLALFGGIVVLVPEGWRVESNVRAIAGGVDLPWVDEPEDEGRPVDLVLGGYAIFGGVSVQTRPFDEDEGEPARPIPITA
jgi:hypothetical protein